MVAQQVGGGATVTLEMIPTLPRGVRDQGRYKAFEVETIILGYENNKGKEIINSQTAAKDGEGCNGTRKEEETN